MGNDVVISYTLKYMFYPYLFLCPHTIYISFVCFTLTKRVVSVIMSNLWSLLYFLTVGEVSIMCPLKKDENDQTC